MIKASSLDRVWNSFPIHMGGFFKLLFTRKNMWIKCCGCLEVDLPLNCRLSRNFGGVNTDRAWLNVGPSEETDSPSSDWGRAWSSDLRTELQLSQVPIKTLALWTDGLSCCFVSKCRAIVIGHWKSSLLTLCFYQKLSLRYWVHPGFPPLCFSFITACQQFIC